MCFQGKEKNQSTKEKILLATINASVKQVKNGDAILVKTSDGQLRANVYDVEEM